jgi:cytochrome c
MISSKIGPVSILGLLTLFISLTGVHQALAQKQGTGKKKSTSTVSSSASPNDKTSTAGNKTKTVKAIAEHGQSEDVKKGGVLISKSDCLACHKEQEKLLGPAYVEVARKYENTKSNIEYLSGKIIKGGSGVWGPVPMSPHPNISDEEAKAMVKYILSLK